VCSKESNKLEVENMKITDRGSVTFWVRHLINVGNLPPMVRTRISGNPISRWLYIRKVDLGGSFEIQPMSMSENLKYAKCQHLVFRKICNSHLPYFKIFEIHAKAEIQTSYEIRCATRFFHVSCSCSLFKNIYLLSRVTL
jgi:hypothetical protein